MPNVRRVRHPSTRALDLKVSVCGAPGAARSALVREIENSKASDVGLLIGEAGDTPQREQRRSRRAGAPRRNARGLRPRCAPSCSRVRARPASAISCWRSTTPSRRRGIGEAFDRASRAFAEFTGKFEFASALALPLSTSSGENVVTPSRHAGWYDGPTLIAHLEALDDGDTALGEADHTQVTEQFAAHIACVSEQEVHPRPRVPAQARRPGADGQRHRREVPPRYRQPAPRAGPHAGPWRHRRVHDRHAHPAGGRRPRRLPPCGTLHARATFSPTRRSPPAPSISPSAAA